MSPVVSQARAREVVHNLMHAGNPTIDAAKHEAARVEHALVRAIDVAIGARQETRHGTEVYQHQLFLQPLMEIHNQGAVYV